MRKEKAFLKEMELSDYDNGSYRGPWYGIEYIKPFSLINNHLQLLFDSKLLTDEVLSNVEKMAEK